MLLKNYYFKTVNINLNEAINKIKNSDEFKVEEYPSYGGQRYSGNIVGKLFLRTVDDNTFQFSENAGLGGSTEIMGKCFLTKTSENSTELKMQFKMYIFPMIFPLYGFYILFTASVILIFFSLIVGISLLVITLLNLLFVILQRSTVWVILKRFSCALNMDDCWQ